MADRRMVDFTVFTKFWTDSLEQLGDKLSSLGFDGVELPVRPGYQVSPDNIQKGLPGAVKILADSGLKIGSIAGPTDEAAISACGQAGIPIIRICVGIDLTIGYAASEEKVLSVPYHRKWPILYPTIPPNREPREQIIAITHDLLDKKVFARVPPWVKIQGVRCKK